MAVSSPVTQGERDLGRLVRSEDKTHTFCIYDAPSPEAIRKTAAHNELPVDRITQVAVLDPYFYI